MTRRYARKTRHILIGLMLFMLLAAPAATAYQHFGRSNCSDAGLTRSQGFQCFTVVPGVYCWYETALLDVMPERNPPSSDPDDPGCSVRSGNTWVGFDVFARDSDEEVRYGYNIEL